MTGASSHLIQITDATAAHNSFAYFTLLNTAAGNNPIGDWAGQSNTFHNIVIANSGNQDFDVESSGGNNSYSHLVMTTATYYGFYVRSSANKFSGNFLIGNNSDDDCIATQGNAGIDSNCAQDGLSTSLAVTESSSVSLVGSFVGPVTSDSVNLSAASGGAASYPAITQTFDFTGFQNEIRVWGSDSSNPYPSLAVVGRWSAGAGRIYDLSLAASGAVIRNRSGNGQSANAAITNAQNCPAWLSGSTTITDLSSPARTFLANAFEIAGDVNGNDNGLCESGETCVAAPNFGAYQGHGNPLLQSCTFANGAVTGVTMYFMPNNGY